MHDWIEGAAMSVKSCGHGNSHPGRWQVRHLPFSQVDKQRCFIPSSFLPSTKTTRKSQESTSSSSIGIGSVRACSSLPSPVVPGRVSPHVSYRAVRRNGRNHAVISSIWNRSPAAAPQGSAPGCTTGTGRIHPKLAIQSGAGPWGFSWSSFGGHLSFAIQRAHRLAGAVGMRSAGKPEGL